MILELSHWRIAICIFNRMFDIRHSVTDFTISVLGRYHSNSGLQHWVAIEGIKVSTPY